MCLLISLNDILCTVTRNRRVICFYLLILILVSHLCYQKRDGITRFCQKMVHKRKRNEKRRFLRSFSFFGVKNRFSRNGQRLFPFLTIVSEISECLSICSFQFMFCFTGLCCMSLKIKLILCCNIPFPKSSTSQVCDSLLYM